MATTDIGVFTHHLLRCESAGEAKPWLDKLVAALCRVTNIELHPEFFLDAEATITEHGKAVSPTTAAQCAEDIERSRVFIQGIYQAIRARIDRGQTVHLLYAGTGPFGLLVVPLLPFFSPLQLQVTLLDIHPRSLDSLNRLLDHLDVHAFVASIECADATQWTPPSGATYDLVVSETMKHLLQQEPQVKIFSHLQQFLADDGELIPQEITLSAWLAGGNEPRQAISLGEFFRLDLATARHLGAGDESILSHSLAVPEYPPQCRHLKLTTSIRVYGDHQLNENQSQLTLPRYRLEARPLAGTQVHCRYEWGPCPDWHFEYAGSALTDEPSRIKTLWQQVQRQKLGLVTHAFAPHEWARDKRALEQQFPSLHSALVALYQSHSFDDFAGMANTNAKN